MTNPLPLLLLLATPQPLVAHVHVALADDVHQGIAPVVGDLGDGSRPDVNLYWGALYGVRRFMPRAGWKLERVEKAPREGVLERAIFSRTIRLEGRRVRAYVVADAWAGPRIGDTIRTFLRHAAGHDPEPIDVRGRRIEAGGAAGVIAYLGHNGLMELPAPEIRANEAATRARAAIVLACLSKSYFVPLLDRAGAQSLLLTKSLMAPEAYTLDAALVAWFSGASAETTRVRAAEAYCHYQKCRPAVGRAMFWSAPD